MLAETLSRQASQCVIVFPNKRLACICLPSCSSAEAPIARNGLQALGGCQAVAKTAAARRTSRPWRCLLHRLRELGAERVGSGSLHRITPIPTNDSGTLYRKGRRVDSRLLTLPETPPEPHAGDVEGGAVAGAGAGAGSGAAAGQEPKQAPEEPKQAAEAGQGDSGYEASEESLGGPAEVTGGGPAEAAVSSGMAPGAPAAAAAGQFWLSAAAEEPEGNRDVASHRVELRGAHTGPHLMSAVRGQQSCLFVQPVMWHRTPSILQSRASMVSLRSIRAEAGAQTR